MRVESLAELEAAFIAWRRKKRHVREAVPEGLRDRARRAMKVHGEGPVARVTKLDRRRLSRGRGRAERKKGRRTTARAVPTFSRAELAAPGTMSRPFAEVETPAGLKLRIYTQTDQTLGLLSALCAMRGA